uniref:Uncharacterized protein n=1 Tax=Amphimedon queenslandica TaxID=400682 RepID=A0A1X7UUM7_AMPQE
MNAYQLPKQGAVPCGRVLKLLKNKMASSLPRPESWKWYHWFSANRLRSWSPTALALLAGAGVTLVYMTDWQVVLRYVPYVRGKFPPIEETPAGNEEEGGD